MPGTPKNPIAEIYNESIDAGMITPSVTDNGKRHALANDAIEKYLKDHHTEQDIKLINEFIGDYNAQYNTEEKKGFKINYKVDLDDKGNVFANRGKEFVKIYAPKSEIAGHDYRKYVSDESENTIMKYAIGKKDESLTNFVNIVDDLKKSGNDISVDDIKKAYEIIDKEKLAVKDKPITKEKRDIIDAEQKMFDALVSINSEIGISTIASLRKTLIYKKDTPETHRVIDNSSGEVLKDSKDAPDLFDRYKNSADKVDVVSKPALGKSTVTVQR